MLDIKPEQNSRQRLNQMLAEANNGNGENFKLGIILLSVFIAILLLIFGIYLFRSKKIAGPISNTNNQIPVKETIVDRLLGNSGATPVNIKDSDNDGLSDQDEITIYKTDPNKTDTDNDGLNDREEVMVYKTDPLKADTDGDGMSDGQEIKLRRNPLDPNPAAEWPPRPTSLNPTK